MGRLRTRRLLDCKKESEIETSQAEQARRDQDRNDHLRAQDDPRGSEGPPDHAGAVVT